LSALLKGFLKAVRELGTLALDAFLQVVFGIPLATLLVNMVPYVGSIMSIVGSGKSWASAYKARKKQQFVDESNIAFSKGDIIEAMYTAFENKLDSEYKRTLAAAVATTASAVGTLVVDIFCPGATPLAGLVKSLAQLTVGFGLFVEQWVEAHKTNELLGAFAELEVADVRNARTAGPGNEYLLDQKSLTVELLKKSWLLSAYMLVLTPNALILNYDYLTLTGTERKRLTEKVLSQLRAEDDKLRMRIERIEQCKETARDLIRGAQWTFATLEDFALESRIRGQEEIHLAIGDAVRNNRTPAAARASGAHAPVDLGACVTRAIQDFMNDLENKQAYETDTKMLLKNVFEGGDPFGIDGMMAKAEVCGQYRFA